MSLFSNENLSKQVAYNGDLLSPREHVNLTLTATSATGPVVVFATTDPYTYQVADVSVSFGTASASGTLNLEYLTGTTASGSGTALFGTAVPLTGTANTPVTSAPTVTKTFTAGTRLGIVLSGTLTGLANCVVRISLKRVS